MKGEQEIAYFPRNCSFVCTFWKISEINDYMHFNLMVFVWWKHTATPSYLLTDKEVVGRVTNTFLFCEVIETTLLQVTSKERGENCHRTKKSTLLAWKKAHLNWIMARDECQFRLPNKNCRRGKGPNSVFFSMCLRRRIKKKEDYHHALPE